MLTHNKTRFLPALAIVLTAALTQAAVTVPLYDVYEIEMAGPSFGPTDKPSETVELYTVWNHESGNGQYKIYGFWDGDGKGGTSGNVFKVRFCPTKTGKWTLTKTYSNASQLNGKMQGTIVECTASSNHGFWVTDGIWFGRSDGSHQYMVGNVHYCLLATDHYIEDLRKNKDYYNKLRFFLAMHGECPMPIKPFFTSSGAQSNAGSDAGRPNPAYFRRADAMIREAAKYDFIIDMYLEGQQKAIGNEKYLRYCAARFGSFPNAWLQLQVEWNEYFNSYSSDKAISTRIAGEKLRQYLPYPTPVSTIGTQNWDTKLNGPFTHANIQGKVFGLKPSQDAIIANRKTAGGIITNNDDNGPNFQGYGGTTREMEVERTLGCFLGCGYTGTGYKQSSKTGMYWVGNFDVSKLTCSRHLKFLRNAVDTCVYFWKMKPKDGPFSNASDCAWMGWAGNQYVIGSSKSAKPTIALPQGQWQVRQFDIMAMSDKILAEKASGAYSFSTPSSAACMTVFTRTELVDKTTAVAATPANFQRHAPTDMRLHFANGLLSVDMNTHISVCNARGRLIAAPRKVDANMAHYDLRSFPAGLYFVRINMPGKSAAFRVCIR